MVVRVYDEPDANAYWLGACGTDDSSSSSTNTPSTTKSSTKCTTTSYTTNNKHVNNGSLLRDYKVFVGNNKEYRIESNVCELRFIGNNNRIRINKNAGNLQVIGNNTRLKIIGNDAAIKYTGNNGHICLGNESAQQTVDYTGCNGILKVKNSNEMLAKYEKCKTKPNISKATETSRKVDQKDLPRGKVYEPEPALPPSEEKAHTKSTSCDRNCSKNNDNNNSNKNKGNSSSTNNWSSKNINNKSCHISSCVSVMNALGNIVIKNAVNVEI